MMKTIIGNWKMYGDAASARALAAAVSEFVTQQNPRTKVVICPPAVHLPTAKAAIGPALKLGGQDCHSQPEGAYTGNISAMMLKDIGCDYVIVGHSERRTLQGETSAIVRAKAAAALAYGLMPVICIGESESERASGRALTVVGQQVKESIPDAVPEGRFLLAYEPVWAIGSGKTPTTRDIEEMHTHIMAVAGEKTGLAPGAVSVLYGGSVKAANAQEILAISGVSGVLVGGASLKAEDFCRIIAAI